MNSPSRPESRRPAEFEKLLATCERLHFIPHNETPRWQDDAGRFSREIDGGFPFRINLFRVSSSEYAPLANWHERLELVMPLDCLVRMRMGDGFVELQPGDLLVVDNLKLHNLEDFPGFSTRLISISFMPEFVCGPASPSCDYAFLVPFYAKRDGCRYVVRAEAETAPALFFYMAELLERYFRLTKILYFQAGCKVSFMQMLYLLTQTFRSAEILRSEYLRRRQQAERLACILDYVRDHYAEPNSISQATQLVRMGPAQFMKVFKEVSGMTFVAHVTRVRLANALRLLRETDKSIADIAGECGFFDQSYFDRRFRKVYAVSPRQYRKNMASVLRAHRVKKTPEEADRFSPAGCAS